DLNRAGSSRENPLLICLQREAKSALPGGSAQMAWRWSGKMEWRSFRMAGAARPYDTCCKCSICLTRISLDRSASTTVKKKIRLRSLGADIATSPDYGMRGGPRAQNRPDALPSCSASRAILRTLRNSPQGGTRSDLFLEGSARGTRRHLEGE